MEVQIPPLEILLRDAVQAENFINKAWNVLEKKGWVAWVTKEFARESQDSGQAAYPSQGLIETAFDDPGINRPIQELSADKRKDILIESLYYLILYNHPTRLEHLIQTEAKPFSPPKKYPSAIFRFAEHKGEALAIGDFGLHIAGLSGQDDETKSDRIKRTERFAHGPWIKLGRFARSPFVGSANPDVWGAAPAIAAMAQTNSLVGLPRDGFFLSIERQVDLAKKTIEWLEHSPLSYIDPQLHKKLLPRWKHNLMGVLEAFTPRGLERAAALYAAGVRCFRIYSPEPGYGLVRTLAALTSFAKKNKWEAIEIFVGQVVNIEQALELEKLGADGIYIGIAGGGRCTTGVRSGSAVDWPELVWDLRGKLHIPVIVEGGASDHVAESFALGVSGIGVTRAAGGGTIESPGGHSYFVDEHSKLFKYYGGEASARMKSMGGRIGPFGIIPYVEGEATKVYLEYDRSTTKPTLMRKVYLLLGDAILSMVFQNAVNLTELQNTGAQNLRRVTLSEIQQRYTH